MYSLPWANTDLSPYDSTHTDRTKIEAGHPVPCRLCEAAYRVLTLTMRYCASCDQGYCQPHHGGWVGRRGACIQCGPHQARARRAVSGPDAIMDRVATFRSERLPRIIAGETPVPLGTGPKLIVYALPLGPNESWSRFRAAQSSDDIRLLSPIGHDVAGRRFTLEGFLTHGPMRDGAPNGYVQFLRDGTIEAVSTGVVTIYTTGEASLLFGSPQGCGPGIAGHDLEKEMIEAVGRFQQLWQNLETKPPVALGLAVTGVEGAMIYPASQRIGLPKATIDRDIVIVPELTVENLAEPVPTMLRGLFDLVWNAGGWPGSPHYVDDQWKEVVTSSHTHQEPHRSERCSIPATSTTISPHS
jgi:hypothetical protein